MRLVQAAHCANDEEILLRSGGLAASVFAHTSVGVLVADESNIIVSVNRAFTDITGYTAAEAVGNKPNLLRSHHHDDAFYRGLWDTLKASGRWQGEIWNRRKNGEIYVEWLTINHVAATEVGPAHYVAAFIDITDLRHKDERIHHLAFHDALTGLPNRFLLQDRLLHAIERSRREDFHLAVLFIDLDGFKGVNDALGHRIGDQLLIDVAERIKSCLRDMDTVARIGGDEFVVLLEDLETADLSARVAANIVARLAAPTTILGHAIRTGASIGIALHPDDGCTPAELIEHADAAMYQAKAAGRSAYRFFRSAPTQRQSQRRAPVRATPRRDVYRLGEAGT